MPREHRPGPFFLASALSLVCGCADPGTTQVESTLRAAFPGASHAVLDAGDDFQSGPGALVAPARTGGLRLELDDEAGLVRLRDVDADFTVTLRETGATGRPARAAHAAAYARAGGTSYWTVDATSIEEWLFVRAPAAGPVATFRVGGASLRGIGDGAVELVDDAGVAHMRVTAPAAFGDGERSLGARLTAHDDTLELWVDGARPDESLLVDPAFKPVWFVASSIFQARVLHTAAALPDGELAIYGGYQGNAPLYDVEVYDPATNRWRGAYAATQPRAGCTATTLLDGRVLVVGGNDGSGFIDGTAGVSLAVVEAANPLVDTAPVVAAPLHVGRQAHTASRLGDGRVLIAGGASGSTLLSTFEIYDPKHDAWSVGDIQNAGYIYHTQTLLGDGTVLLVAGQAERFDPQTDTSSVVPSPHSPRQRHTATLLADGRVLIVGGSAGGTGPSFSSAELYDPTANQWTVTGSLASPRQQHSAALLADGRVIVIGGFTSYGGHALITTEIFDPTTSSWSVGPPLHDGRTANTINTLGQGQVVVTGGANLSVNFGFPNYAALASVEIYLAYRRDLGLPCSTSDVCGSGFCVDGVCCETACDDSPCSVCSVAAGAPVEGQCTTLDAFACKAHPCTANAQCETNHCADGVCCDAACDGTCQTCAVERGVCTFAPFGSDARLDCNAGARLVCAMTCDGQGQCVQSTDATPCIPAGCVDETHASSPVLCGLPPDGGALACPTDQMPVVSDCAPFTCDPVVGACKTSCDSVRDCPTGFVCTPAGSCQKPPSETAEDASGCAVSGLDDGSGRAASAAFSVAALALLGAARRRRRSQP